MRFKKYRKIISLGFILGGASLVALAFIADYLIPGGETGFGYKQAFLLIMGVCFIVCGSLLASPFGSRVVNKVLSFSPKEISANSLIILSIWFGGLTGFAEVVIIAYKRYFTGEIMTYRSQHFFWMTPLGDILLFLIPGLIFFIIGRIRWKSSVLNSSLFVFLFLFSTGLLLWFPEIHFYAILLLAVGITTQTSRFLIDHQRGFYKLVSLTYPGFLIATGLFYFLINGFQATKEQLALNRLPPASQGANNVLLIVMDTVRAQNLSLYGYDRPTTPNLQELSKNGVVFDWAISPSSWTLPSHASMFTGRWLHELSVGVVTPLDDQYPTLAEVLASKGYLTAGFIANTFYCGNEFGLSRGFDHYEDYTKSLTQAILYTSLADKALEKLGVVIGRNRFYWPKTAEQVNSEFLHWLANHQTRPFFAFLNYIDAHDPYMPPDNFEGKFGSPELRANPYTVPIDQRSQEEIQAEIDAYDGSIAYLDHQIGQLMTELNWRGILENTLVIIVSDHGEQFNDHSLNGHSNSLYLQAIHVPLVILLPDQLSAGERVDATVSLRDLPATILDLITTDDKNPLAGTSFVNLFQVHGFSSVGSRTVNDIDPVLSELNYCQFSG